MAILTNFPLDCKDQVDVIEIFHGLMRQSDDAKRLTEGSPRKPVSALPDLSDLRQRGPSAPIE
jgi:hypothetical protein